LLWCFCPNESGFSFAWGSSRSQPSSIIRLLFAGTISLSLLDAIFTLLLLLIIVTRLLLVRSFGATLAYLVVA